MYLPHSCADSCSAECNSRKVTPKKSKILAHGCPAHDAAYTVVATVVEDGSSSSSSSANELHSEHEEARDVPTSVEIEGKVVLEERDKEEGGGIEDEVVASGSKRKAETAVPESAPCEKKQRLSLRVRTNACIRGLSLTPQMISTKISDTHTFRHLSPKSQAVVKTSVSEGRPKYPQCKKIGVFKRQVRRWLLMK
jgi:hypothetical protein